MRPCWAVLFGFENPLSVEFDGAFVNVGPLGWVARNASKPGRPPTETWVVHASHDWSQDNLERPADVVADALTTAFFDVVEIRPVRPMAACAHRWRYAEVEKPLGEACLYDAGLRIGAAGDWCLGARIEAAYVSGFALAERVLSLPHAAIDPIGAVQ